MEPNIFGRIKFIWHLAQSIRPGGASTYRAAQKDGGPDTAAERGSAHPLAPVTGGKG